MKNSLRFFSIASVLSFSLLLLACGKEDEPEQVPFDRKPMLMNYAQQVILPRYHAYRLSAQHLHASALAFELTPDLTSLDSLRSAFVAAYLNYQAVAPFEFGPAESIQFRAQTNIFPTDTTQILFNIAQGAIDLNLVENADAKGFPALDFLLFRPQSNINEILVYFTNQPFLFTYLATVTSRIAADADFLFDQWSSSYQWHFIDANGTDISSSTGYLVNQLNFELDLLKNAKLAIPMGLQTLNMAQPQKTEALYSQISLNLAQQSLKAIKEMYLGNDTLLHNGLGLDDYLLSLPLENGNGTLHANILSKFNAAETKLAAINAPIDMAVVQNAQAVQDAYAALIQLLVLLKTDLPSQLGIVINYQDGDGD